MLYPAELRDQFGWLSGRGRDLVGYGAISIRQGSGEGKEAWIGPPNLLFAEKRVLAVDWSRWQPNFSNLLSRPYFFYALSAGA